MAKQYDLLMIEWEDSTCRTGWHRADTAPKFADQIVTVGFVISRDSKHITVAQSLCEDRSVDSAWLIPRANIRKVHKLIRVKAPKGLEESDRRI